MWSTVVMFANLLQDAKALSVQMIVIILQNEFSKLSNLYFLLSLTSKAKHLSLPAQILFPKEKDVIEVELGKYRP